MRRLLALLVLLAAGCGTVAMEQRPAEQGGVAEGDVVRVVDGDTIRVRVDGREERVRLIGIDTPEVRPRGGGPPECHARAATGALRDLVGGRRVRLVPGAEPRDRYGRLLAYVERADDGLDVNERLVRAGHARTLEVAPNTGRAEAFARAERDAQDRGAGLWSACGG